MELRIEYIPVDRLKPYDNNTRKHGPDDIEQIKASIEADGFNDPIGVWGDENIIVEGHGRLMAAKEMGLETVPCIRLDHLSDTQRRDYAIRHNRTAELSAWDFGRLEEEMARLEIEGVDLSGLGFDLAERTREEVDRYTKAVRIPQYEPKEEAPDIWEMVDTGRAENLIAEIDASGVSCKEKEFLRICAYRHAVIDFDKVADYYASADPEMQRLMERQALVLIDYQDAIAEGYAALSGAIDEAVADE